jgi:stearoyl-CoA desaturase (delta-9 desaturase)
MAPDPRWNLLNTVFLTGTLTAALVLVPWRLAVAGLGWSEALVFLAMTFAVGTAISGGYHRLFSHRAFQASWPVRFLFLCLGAAAFENSALKWASDHRIHHQHVDTEQDPYQIGKGFWHAHWTWVMEARDLPLSGVADLEKDPLVRWQHRYHFLIGAGVALIPVGIGLATGNLVGHLVFGVLLRIVVNHHTTFLINSAAHTFGSRPYTDANTARDNWLLALLTYGEGYHNFHHLWQWDYRNGALWYQWDTTKWLLNVLAWAGLVGRFRRVSAEAMAQARLLQEEKRLREQLLQACPSVARPLQARLAAARERLGAALQANRAFRSQGMASLVHHRTELKAAWREWKATRLAVRSAPVFA